MLEPESVVVQPQSEQLADEHEHHDVEKDRKRVVFVSAMHCEVAQGAVPSRCQQHDEKHQSEDKISDTEPSPNAVIPQGFGRIGWTRNRGDRCAHL